MFDLIRYRPHPADDVLAEGREYLEAAVAFGQLYYAPVEFDGHKEFACLWVPGNPYEDDEEFVAETPACIGLYLLQSGTYERITPSIPEGIIEQTMARLRQQAYIKED